MAENPPAFLKKYFWDVNFEKLDFSRRRVMVLKRIMEYGDKEAVMWMRANFTDSEIKDVLIKCRDFSQKSANFWAVMLDIDRGEVKCLSRSFRETQKVFWPY